MPVPDLTADLPSAPPAVYFPFERGRYEVSAGLLQLGRHPVHGRVESHVFAFDREYGAFLAEKVASRRRGLHLYYQQAALAPELRAAVLGEMLAGAARDSGGAIRWDGEVLSNAWLGWSGVVDVQAGSARVVRREWGPLAHLVAAEEPLDALDFLALNVQEDFSILARHPGTGDDWLAVLHVSYPQHWDPRDKVGRAFGPVHAPVAGSAAMIKGAPRLVGAVIDKGPFLRFAWGVATSARLDHHPAGPPDADRTGEGFDPDRTWLRVERQTLWGFPAQHGAFFTIRPYVYPLRGVTADPERRGQLALALRSMTPEQLEYKGMATLRGPLVAWLESP